MSLADVAPDVLTGVVVAQAKAFDARDAAEEIARRLPREGLATILVFLAPFYEPQVFLDELTRLVPDTPIHGCTTAGELTLDGWDEDSVVAMGFASADFVTVARPFLDLATFRVDQGRTLCRELHTELERKGCRTGETFGLFFIDGMCRREEAVMSAIYAALDDVPVVGGSAGDGLRFDRPWIFFNGRAYADAAVLILFRTPLPFRLFKCDNFEPTSKKMVVTEADIEKRIVKEINAEPAAQEYSRVVGLNDAKLDAFSFASHPVLVRVGGSHYVRSIQRMNPDGSLSFFCAIDEGMVLTVARPRDLEEATSDMFAETQDELGDVAIYIGFECILRRLDAEQHQKSRQMSDLYRRNRVVGFHTYGEQFRSMHVNQTLAGVAIGRRAERP